MMNAIAMTVEDGARESEAEAVGAELGLGVGGSACCSACGWGFSSFRASNGAVLRAIVKLGNRLGGSDELKELLKAGGQ